MRSLLLSLALLAACGPDVNVTPHKVDKDGDGYAEDIDCDDTHATVNPDAAELCDGLDNDCDGALDEDATDAGTWYADADGDGFGDEDAATVACDAPAGAVAEATDCDDAEAAAFPGNAEICDGLDNDCDGAVDDGASDLATFYVDADGDGRGDPATAVLACEAGVGEVADGTDCDDADPTVHPGAVEDDCADPTDYNCDGSVGYADLDEDGTPACNDCDDGDAGRSPAAVEVCDEANVDEDCDALADDADPSTETSTRTMFYADADGDTYGDGASAIAQCDRPAGHVTNDDDCDDTTAARNPGRTEVCDAANVDEDCDGLADDADTTASGTSLWYRDADGDGYAGSTTAAACDMPAGHLATSDDCDDAEPDAFPGGVEVCDDGVDQDCSGADEACPAPEFDDSYAVDDGYDTKIYGVTSSAGFGKSLVTGDFDGDGVGDLVVGAHGTDHAGALSAYGTVYGYRGPFHAGAQLATAHDDFLYYSTDSAYNMYSQRLFNIGDTDGDDRDDLLVGLTASLQAARYLGGDTGEYAHSSAVDGTATCISAAPAGDFDATTSTDEWICGTTVYSSYAGVAYVYGTGGTVATFTGEMANDYAGVSVAGGGDVDGDGYEDVWVGAFWQGSLDYGAAYLVYGPASGTMGLASADAKMRGTATSQGVGYQVVMPGDVDDDGHDDVIVTAFHDGSGDGTGVLYVVTEPTSGPIASIASATFLGEDLTDNIGYERVSTGDVNGDGNVDLVAGSKRNADVAFDAGSAWLVYGPFAGTSTLATADAEWLGRAESDHLGDDVAVISDVDGDGKDEIAFGASDWDEGSDEGAGAVWIWLGR